MTEEELFDLRKWCLEQAVKANPQPAPVGLLEDPFKDCLRGAREFEKYLIFSKQEKIALQLGQWQGSEFP